MKKILFLLALALVLSSANAQSDKEVIEGNGKSITKEVAVKSFDELKANGVYELLLTQGDKESVKI